MPSPTPVFRPNRWDAIVVGGRVAGASTAMLLARDGMRVLLLDRARRGSDTLSTHALMRGGVLQLHRWALLEPLRIAGTPPVRRTTFHYGDETVPVSIKPLAGVDALYAPRRPLLDGVLADAAERAGAELRFGATVSDLVRDDDGRVSGVVVAERGGSARVERARLVVGADGRASAVAARVQAAPVLRGQYATRLRVCLLATARTQTATSGTTGRTHRPASSRRTMASHVCSPGGDRTRSCLRCVGASQSMPCVASSLRSTRPWPT